MTRTMAPALIAGEWKQCETAGVFRADNPSTGEALPEIYPISTRDVALAAVTAGNEAAEQLYAVPAEQIAAFLEGFAAGIEGGAEALVETAHAETGLPKTPRLAGVELPRTTDQLRQAAAAAREGSWRRPVRDETRKIYSQYAPLGGPVVVMGPNNFPFAFNSVSGGDFAAAIAAHNPVIAKANPAHPGTTRLLGEIAFKASQAAGLPPATVQLLYHLPKEVGLELVAHPLVGATAFTGSRKSGLALKEAADGAGKPIYLEMSSVNPILILEGALRERGAAIADEFFTSCTMAAGQFCTNPGFLIIPEGAAGQEFINAAVQRFQVGTPGILLAKSGLSHLAESVEALQRHGATLLCGGAPAEGPAYRYANSLLTVSAADFLRAPQALQTEAFGPVALLVRSADTRQTISVIRALEGNLTGTIYSDTAGSDDAEYAQVEPHLRRCVGRLINDRMPTGVAVSPAMNHGGPYPATGHPGFTAVGLPASIQRFAALHCYDNVRPGRLPASLG